MANVFFTEPGLGRCVRRIPVHSYRPGTDYVVDLDVVARQATPEVRIGCTVSGWLELSSDGGGSYDPVPTDVTTGPDLGPMTEDQHQAVKLKISVPGVTEIRQRFVELLIGLGT